MKSLPFLENSWFSGLTTKKPKKERFRFLKGFEEIRGNEFRLILLEKLSEDRVRGWVPSYRYDIVSLVGSDLIGSIDIRIGENENIFYAGHIGYRIHEQYRGRHYAEKACRLIIRVARAHNMKEVVITCNPDNLASKKTIKNLGATYVGLVEIPPRNELYHYGDRYKLRFIWQVPDLDEAEAPPPDRHLPHQSSK